MPDRPIYPCHERGAAATLVVISPLTGRPVAVCTRCDTQPQSFTAAR